MSWRNWILIWPLYLFGLVVTVSISLGNIAAGAIVITALLYLAVTRDRAALPPRPVLIALAAYLAVHALAILFADPYPARWDKWTEELWLKLVLVAVPVLGMRHPRQVAGAVKLAIGVGLLVALYGVWQFFSGEDLVRGLPLYRIGGFYQSRAFFGHHLSYAGQLLLLLVFAAAWALYAGAPGGSSSGGSSSGGSSSGGSGSGGRRQLGWRYLAPLILLAALITTLTRGPLLGAGAGLLVIVLSLPSRRRWTTLVLIALAMLPILELRALRSRFAQILSGGEETRLNLWQSSIAGIADRPWLGFGQGNFEHLMDRHRVAGFYEVEGHAHNDFLMHGVNAGLLGLLAALALLIVVTWLLWRGFRRRPESPFAWILLGGIAAQIAISIAGFFQVYQTDDEVEMLLYFLLGAALAVLPRDGDIRPAIHQQPVNREVRP